ncbi:hypothetical protein [Chroogloeocystis siderophila]|uniref:hypothetical protein n=1 Tax=Chroogloeocystis siderophila TaxID=329163 RepID=UPI0015BCCE36|nr:hypothetical protein [Chroogloeocystis siderophila]
MWEASKQSDGILRNVLVQVRNLWRFAISGDERYGSVYNLSIAHYDCRAHECCTSDRSI